MKNYRKLIHFFFLIFFLFRFSFTAIARFTYGADQGCGGQVNVDSSTQIQSLDTDHDGNYEADLNCQWLLSGQAGKILKLTFTRFNVEREQNSTSVTCWDYVEVRDGHSPFSPLIGHFCGAEVPSPVRTSSNFMWVKFFSDSTTNQPGFAATIQTEDPLCGGSISINDTTTSEVIKALFCCTYNLYVTQRSCMKGSN